MSVTKAQMGACDYEARHTTDCLGGRYEPGSEPLDLRTRNLSEARARASQYADRGGYVRRVNDGASLAPDGSWVV